MKDISWGADNTLRAILYHEAMFRYTPSIREICLEVGLKSPASVHKHLNELDNLGLIDRIGPQNRIYITELGRQHESPF